MTNKQFDQMVRRHIEMEDIQMSNYSENRLEQKLQKPRVQRTVRRISTRSLVLATLILALLCGVALAAVTWNSREYLSYTDKEGTLHANEPLIELAQPVGKTFEGKDLRIDVVDAIYDGRSLVLTWTMQSKRTEGELYLLMENARTQADTLVGQGARRSVDEIFLKPGETVTSGMTTLFETVPEGDTCDISFTYSVLAPKGEVVAFNVPSHLEGDAYTQAYRAEVNALNSQGKVVLAPDGVIELGDDYPPYVEGMTRTDVYVAAGKMELLETVEVRFSVSKNAEAETVNPLLDGKVIEKDNGDYILRVVKAEFTPNSVMIDLERVFPSKEMADKYAPYYTEKLGPYWGFSFEDETNSNWFHNGGGSNADAPLEMDDGSWVWGYQYSMTALQSMPRTITIIPYRDNPETGEYNVPYPDEAIVLQVP